MRFKWMIVASLLVAPALAQSTEQWSSCQTVTGVSNYLAYANSVLLTLSPGIPGCAPVDIAGAVMFMVNVDGVTSDNIGSFLASGYSAYLSGHQVTIYYDNSSIAALRDSARKPGTALLIGLNRVRGMVMTPWVRAVSIVALIGLFPGTALSCEHEVFGMISLDIRHRGV